LNINTAVRLAYEGGGGGGGKNNGGGSNPKGGTQGATNQQGKGSITVDSLDAKFKQVLNLNWKKC